MNGMRLAKSSAFAMFLASVWLNGIFDRSLIVQPEAVVLVEIESLGEATF